MDCSLTMKMTRMDLAISNQLSMIMLLNLMSGYSFETLSPTFKNKPSVTFIMFCKKLFPVLDSNVARQRRDAVSQFGSWTVS